MLDDEPGSTIFQATINSIIFRFSYAFQYFYFTESLREVKVAGCHNSPRAYLASTAQGLSGQERSFR